MGRPATRDALDKASKLDGVKENLTTFTKVIIIPLSHARDIRNRRRSRRRRERRGDVVELLLLLPKDARNSVDLTLERRALPARPTRATTASKTSHTKKYKLTFRFAPKLFFGARVVGSRSRETQTTLPQIFFQKMAQLAQSGTGPGNTRKRARAWCFTLNNYEPSDIIYLKDVFGTPDTDGTRYCFQEEMGEDGLTPHLQGVVHFRNARDFKAIKTLHGKAHWEACRDLKRSVRYCSKDETRNGKVFVQGFTLPERAKDPLDGQVFRPWQAELRDKLCQDPHPRKIHWFVDVVGACGKTTFAKHMVIKHGALYVSGKSTDIKYAVGMADKRKIIIFDFVRSLEGFISYEAIEAVKNGIFFSAKYESKTVLFDTPHVVVFSNFEPERSKLSEDRWDVHHLYNLGT